MFARERESKISRGCHRERQEKVKERATHIPDADARALDSWQPPTAVIERADSIAEQQSFRVNCVCACFVCVCFVCVCFVCVCALCVCVFVFDVCVFVDFVVVREL